jgi:predicted HTH domain antitoxin
LLRADYVEIRELAIHAGSLYSHGVNLTLPREIETRLTASDVVLHLAIGLYADDQATLGQAAEIAGLPQSEFLRELGRCRIPIHYGSDELAEDLLTVERLAAS